MKEAIDVLCIRVTELLQERTTLAQQLEAVAARLKTVTEERDKLLAERAEPETEEVS